MTAQVIDRALPERSMMAFYFPIPQKGGENSFYVIRIPFFENISIKESKKARYQKYSLISRSSNLYSYLGADSRQFSLDFNITLPHIMDLHPGASQYTNIYNVVDSSKNTEKEKARFTKPFSIPPTESGFGMSNVLGNDYERKAKETARLVYDNLNLSGALTYYDKIYFTEKYGITDPSIDATIKSLDNIGQANLLSINSRTLKNPLQTITQVFTGTALTAAAQKLESTRQEYQQSFRIQDNLKYKLIDLIVYWVNIIRSSVVNNAKNPMYGPPIIRLTHGILYQDIPCICTDYSLDFNESAGYDLDTLLPRQIKVSLKLEELRTGDFGAFEPRNNSSLVKRDNLAGWEAVVLGDTLSMDPGSGGY